MAVSESEIERSPDYWWLRYRYAMRDRRKDDALEAQRRLAELGIQVKSLETATADGSEEGGR